MCKSLSRCSALAQPTLGPGSQALEFIWPSSTHPTMPTSSASTFPQGLSSAFKNISGEPARHHRLLPEVRRGDVLARAHARGRKHGLRDRGIVGRADHGGHPLLLLLHRHGGRAPVLGVHFPRRGFCLGAAAVGEHPPRSPTRPCSEERESVRVYLLCVHTSHHCIVGGTRV